ncbi:MAG: hypothetical protein P9L97_09555 [Candidatus Tenebribacter davisii]|nr:hypothetical protein [Candidatus Tenebribacter davisii]
MRIRIFIILYLLLSASLKSQIIEHSVISLFERFGNSPFSEISQSGIGNLGFDNDISNYNPKLLGEYETLIIKTSIVSNMITSSDLTIAYPTYNWEESYDNVIKVIPNFSIAYKYRNLLIQLNYDQTKYINVKDKINDLLLTFHNSGTYNWGKTKYFVSNQILQLSLVKKFYDGLSLSFGILTNSYVQKISGDTSDEYLQLSLKLLKKYQFQSSLNYKINRNFNIYFLIKSQRARIKLSPEKFEIYNDIILTNSFISYPALIACGTQINLSNKTKVSLEILNYFINKHVRNEYDMLIYDNNTSKILAALGINHQLNKNVFVGLMYNSYLIYDINIKTSYSDTFKDRIIDPYSIILSSIYSVNSFSFSFSYQYSNNGYYEDSAIDQPGREFSHFITIGLSKSFF